VPVIEKLLGIREPGVRFRLQARLTTNLPSLAGREDWVAGCLQGNPPEYMVAPIFSKSNLIFSLVRANCLIRVPPDATGLAEGEMVEVLLLS
jgi:molybdopterin molybdotransferase